MDARTVQPSRSHAGTARRNGTRRGPSAYLQCSFAFVREGPAHFDDALRFERTQSPHRGTSGRDAADIAATRGSDNPGRANATAGRTGKKARDDKPLTDEQRSLIVEHLDDAYRVAFARDFTHRSFSDAEREERRTIAENGLIKAVMRFDPSRGCSFRTFMYRTIKYAILDANVARKAKKRSFVVFTDMEGDDDE